MTHCMRMVLSLVLAVSFLAPAVLAGDAPTKQAVKQQAEGKPPVHPAGKELARLKPPQIVQPDPANRHLTAEQYPRVGGSTSAHPLGVIVACELTGTPYFWTTGAQRTVQPTRAPNPPVPPLQGPGPDKSPPLHQKTWHHGTHGAYSDLINNKCNLILVARQASRDEDKLAEKRSIEFVYTPVAKDAFVFITNQKNPVENLSLQQVREMYLGKLTGWQAVGGPEKDIHAYVRNRNSGSQETMEMLVLGGKPTIEGRSMVTLSMMGPLNALARDPQGIGYTFYYYQARMKPDPRIKLLSIDGVQPSAETIADGSYPVVTDVWAVMRKDTPQDSAEGKVVQWMLSPAGQKTVAASGYVPVQPAE